MTIPLTTDSVLFAITVISIVFNVYQYFKKPQDKQELDGIKLTDRVATLEKEINEMRQTHLVAMEKDIKELSGSVQNLSLTVAKLSTIIDERIPKGTFSK